MTALAPVPQRPLPEAVARIASFMADFSVEATRPSDADIAAMSVLPRGTRVYLSAVPGRPAEESLSAAVRLRAAGFEPVPHLAVRNFATSAALDDFLARLTDQVQVRRVLVIAGDRAECGPFRCALDAIDSGVLRRRGIRAIGVAGYPDGHPKIGPDELRRALAEKIAAAEATGVAVEIVTQFCFDAQRMLDYVAQLRAYGFEQPVRIGLAGPTSLSSLLRYASRCGVRASAQALAQRAGLIRQVFALTVPDDLIRALADSASTQKSVHQKNVHHVSAHFFSFGGLGPTARWTRAVADGRIALEGAAGFRVMAPGE